MIRKLIPALLVLAACDPAGAGSGGAAASSAAQDGFKLPSDPANYAPHEKFEAMKIPADNPITAAKAELGWKLFFDKRLSKDGSRSCYSCHLNEKGLTEGIPKGISAVDGKSPLARHTPTLWNIGYHAELYWDGRAKSLEGQALAAWKLANMGAKDPAKDEIRADIIAALEKAYGSDFQKAFGGAADEKKAVQALASYMRTIISQTTPWDRHLKGEAGAVSDAAKRGFEVFNKAKCVNCHSGAFFTDLQFHNVGIGMKAEKPDVGRFNVTKIEKDTGAFKTPTLRDVARSGPYFHDGSVASLEEAVKLLVAGGIDNPHLDKTNLQPATLTATEVSDLVEFLKSLSETATLKEPKLP
jgi:cytochrome c peroxidase